MHERRTLHRPSLGVVDEGHQAAGGRDARLLVDCLGVGVNGVERDTELFRDLGVAETPGEERRHNGLGSANPKVDRRSADIFERALDQRFELYESAGGEEPFRVLGRKGLWCRLRGDWCRSRGQTLARL